jgi:hypothetical protein
MKERSEGIGIPLLSPLHQFQIRLQTFGAIGFTAHFASPYQVASSVDEMFAHRWQTESTSTTANNP